MVDVFISYARESRAYAQCIAEAAAREGYSVWWDEDLPPHLSYGDVITEKIGAAKAVIVVWSAAAADSEWVRAEADLARGQKKLIQTSIDGRLPPMPFNQIQFAPIGDWQGEPDHPGWKKVRASLSALCGGGQPSTTSTMPAAARSMATATTAPPPAGNGGVRALPIALAGAAVLLVAAGGGWYLMRGGGEVEAKGSGGSDPATERESPAREEAEIAATPARPATAQFIQAAVIDDPDGFTNVRSGPAATFPVVARIDQGEVFTTYPQAGEWWQVRTADSRVGFMARSRIRVIEAPDAAGGGEAEPDLADSGLAPAGAVPSGGAEPALVFPGSSRRRLRPAELADLAPAQLRLARNEIFARHGRPFRDPTLRGHFERFSWYEPRPGPIALNPIEQANVRLLQQAESK